MDDIDTTTIPDRTTHPSWLATQFLGLAHGLHGRMLAGREDVDGIDPAAQHIVCADLDVAAVTGAVAEGTTPRPMWRQTFHSSEEAKALMVCGTMLVKRVAEMAFEAEQPAFQRIQEARAAGGRWNVIADLNGPHVSVGIVGKDGFDEIARIENPGALH